MKIPKIPLFVISILILIFDTIAILIWISNSANIIYDIRLFLVKIMSNMLTLVIFADLLVFSIITIIWLFLDTGKRKMKIRTRIIILFLTMTIGSPVLMMYLSFRKKDE